MIGRLFGLITLVVLAALIFISVQLSSAGGLTCPTQHIRVTDVPLSAEEVKPSECDGISLDNHILSGSGSDTDLTGTCTFSSSIESPWNLNPEVERYGRHITRRV